MSVRDASDTIDRIVAITKELWSRQHELDLDQVDGTFYFRVCLAERFREMKELLEEQGRYSPDFPLALMASLIPNWALSWPYPRMRDAHISWQFSGTVVKGKPPTVDVITCVRDRSWTGEQVEQAVREFVAGDKLFQLPEFGAANDAGDREVLQLEATFFASGEYSPHRQYWNPSLPDPSMPDVEALWAAASDRSSQRLAQPLPDVPDDTRRQWEEIQVLREVADALEQGPWETAPWGPVVMLTVPFPLPPIGVISSYYDGVVRKRRAWHEQLGRSTNAQEVPTAIRTWSTALLMMAGVELGKTDLYWTRVGPDIKPMSFQRFQASRNTLLKRVPEARSFLTKRVRN